VAFLALALGLSACGSSTDAGPGGKPPDYSALKQAPPPLAGLYKQPDELLDGGKDAYEARLAELKGHPVVVNVWASWCGPCRAEFPLFQQASAKLGKRIAFLGINAEDSESSAKAFLADYPVPYPSYTDPDKGIVGDFGIYGYPKTVFYSPSGEQTYVKQGQYSSSADLMADIKQYAE